MREQLPEDGADYPCSFEFRWPEPWRCPKTATEAIDQETYDKYTEQEHHKNVCLHGRALCEIHLILLDQ